MKNLIFLISFALPLLTPSLGLSAPSCKIAAEGEVPLFKVGDKVKTPQDTRLTVLMVITDGHKGLVYKVQDKDGKVYALKVIRDTSEDVVESFKLDQSRLADIKKIPGLHYADILEVGSNYLLKEWVEGLRGDKWMKEWLKTENVNDPLYIKLQQLYTFLANQKIRIGNLKDLNLIYDGNNWVIVDSSAVIEKPDVESAKRSYVRKFRQGWIRQNPTKFEMKL